MQGVILKESELLDIALNNKKVKKADIPNILVVLSKHYFSLARKKYMISLMSIISQQILDIMKLYHMNLLLAL